MKSKSNRKKKNPSPKVTESKPIRKTRSLSRKKPGPKPKELLDIDDCEMNELLTEFAEVEKKKKKNVIKIDDKESELDSLVEEFASVDTDSEDEFDSLLEEFATAESDPEDEQKKSASKVILSPSDDEIDDLLDDFKDDDLK